ncbi:tRNA pseudouridine(55) synthase [Neorickettsia helminthoeca str. Oregon]|uniref:tRNA pseudouridine synthase B n=1 Tax=Neorickettsia helminthoeca str. Oregon TaxID=1286528 RepID=X5HL47_9RICK|nr:tRNA pseudouridine(55) synthase TruB [Neorickettsia helminthoeca]AHX11065.1 tRNA pseudouridine(55) synthase [Neorickettsia helminthoeca str. Oregon]
MSGQQCVEGWLNLDKERGISSFGALRLVKRKLGIKKAGYLGTLDPLATGVLVIAVGKATKLIPKIDDSEKAYDFTVEWGAETDTLDSEGQIIRSSDNIPGRESILEVLPLFIGEVTQIPPRFSAVHINGRRAYSLARAGIEFDINPKTVVIHALELIEHVYKRSIFRVLCGRGTYVRAIARDIAHKLDSLAFVSGIRRTKSGIFGLADSHTLSEITLNHLVPIIQEMPLRAS